MAKKVKPVAVINEQTTKKEITSEEALAALRAEEQSLYQEFADGIAALSQKTGYGLAIHQGIVIEKLKK